MEKFELNVLGCGSALPTVRHYPSSQVLNVRDKLFMIDCGEAAQLQFRRLKLKYNRLNHIFLSHLHGDHCFGLPGLVSSLGLAGRTGELVIHAHADAERIFSPMFDYFCQEMPFRVRFDPIEPQRHALIFEDKSVRVYTLPLKHRVPTCGFLFEEKTVERHLLPDMIRYYEIPHYQLGEIRAGADFVTSDGRVIENARLTRPGPAARRYAYCCDTLCTEKVLPYVAGVDLLYHDATFGEELKFRARETFHTTALQAATLAKKAGVKRLMLGHFSARYLSEEPLLEEAKSVFEHTVLAHDATVYPI